jgi:uncharacterized membrane protein HdeD (DUF308 family)
MPRPTRPLRFESEEEAGLPSGADGMGKPFVANGASFEPDDKSRNSLRRPSEGPPLSELLGWLARSLAILAVLSSVALLCVGITPLLTTLPSYLAKATLRSWALVKNMPLSAIPLFLAGSSYIILQALLRPRPLELLKRLLLGAAFILWGVVQLMRASSLAVELGNLVIALYVLDLGIIIWTDLPKNQPRLVR